MPDQDGPSDDDGLDDLVDRIRFGGPRLDELDSSRPTRGEEVRAAARLVHELIALTSTPGGDHSAARTFESSIASVAVDAAVLEWGARLGWPGRSGDHAAARLLDGMEERRVLELRSIQMLPAGRLSSAILRRLVRAAARFGVPFDAASDDERMPSFLRDASMELERRGIAVDEEMEAIRRRMSAERRAHREADLLRRDPARRLAALEDREGVALPTPLRAAWLAGSDLPLPGARFDDPLEDCYRDALFGASALAADVAPHDRILLFGTAREIPDRLEERAAARVDPGDLRCALDLGRPVASAAHVDYPVLLVTGADQGQPHFVCELAPSTAEWFGR